MSEASDKELHMAHLLETAYSMIKGIEMQEPTGRFPEDSQGAFWLRETRELLCEIFPTKWEKG